MYGILVVVAGADEAGAVVLWYVGAKHFVCFWQLVG